MKFQASLSIRQKLHVLGFVSIVGALTLAGLSLLFSGRVAESARVIHEERFAPLTRLQELSTELKEVRFRLAGVLLEQMPVPGSRIHLRDTAKAAPAQWREFKQAVGALEGEPAALVAAIDRDLPELERFAQVLELAYAAADKQRLTVLLEDEWPVVQLKLVKRMDALLPSLSQSVAREAAALGSASRQFRAIAAGAALLVLVVTLAIAILVGRSLIRGVREAVQVAEALAGGDLTYSREVAARDELGQLLAALGATIAQLRGTIAHVRGGTDAMSVAAGDIAAGNADLSQRTEEQASSLEETASTMEELTRTVQQNAEHAKQASALAVGASGVAQQGGSVIGQVVRTMGSINESSRRIVDITSVIDAIAFQTNILALNAAVEAARAGDQGRGFAVVAGEVRTLAQRSAASAREIKQLIADSVREVEDGTRLVDLAGKTMDQIVESVKQVTELIAEIAAASQQQTSGIEEVNRAIVQMDQMTQRNAAMVEQASSAAEAMKEQAQNLVQTVAVFRLASAAREAPRQPPGGPQALEEARPALRARLQHAGAAA